MVVQAPVAAVKAEVKPNPAVEWEPYERQLPNTDRIYRKFSGAYPSLVESLLQPRPDTVDSSGNLPFAERNCSPFPLCLLFPVTPSTCLDISYHHIQLMNAEKLGNETGFQLS